MVHRFNHQVTLVRQNLHHLAITKVLARLASPVFEHDPTGPEPYMKGSKSPGAVLPPLSLDSVRSKNTTSDQKKILAQIVRFDTIKKIANNSNTLIVKSTSSLGTFEKIREYHNRLIQSAFRTPNPWAQGWYALSRISWVVTGVI